MTITATPDITSTPPKVTVAMSVPVGAVMSAISVWRGDSSGHTLLRTQPAAGFDSRTVTDYDCPYGEAVTYDWTATYSGSFTTVWDELWASTAAWTVIAGTWNVSGGKLRNTSATANISRDVTPAKCRVTISSFTEATATSSEMAINIIAANLASVLSTTAYVSLRLSAAGVLSIYYKPDGGFSTLISTTAIDTTQPMTIDFNGSSITVTGTGGSVTFAGDMLVGSVRIYNTSITAPNGMSVGEVKVQTYDSPTVISETSSPVTLSPLDAWLVHPATPAKSFKLSNTVAQAAGVRTFGPVTNKTNATLHDILGSSTPVTVNVGPRGDDESTVTIATVTNAERQALRNCLSDDLPLLVQVPPSWASGFASGWYAFGDSSERRHGDYLSVVQQARMFDIPITKTFAPIVDVQNSGWSWAQLAAEFPTWDAVKAAFATWDDVAANNRI